MAIVNEFLVGAMPTLVVGMRIAKKHGKHAHGKRGHGTDP
jgi:hypothetical protein